PAQVRITQGIHGPSADKRTIEHVIGGSDITHVRIIPDIEIPGEAVGRTQFHFVDSAAVAHKILFGKPPGKGEGWERAPPVLGTEPGRSIASDRSGRNVFFLKAVVG